MWVKRLEESDTPNTLKTGKHELRRYIKTPVNVQLVKAVVGRSPKRSALNHALVMFFNFLFIQFPLLAVGSFGVMSTIV